MSSVDVRNKHRTNGAPQASKNGSGNGNGHSKATPRSIMFPQVIPGQYRKPYGCVICGLQLSDEDAARLDRIIAEHGNVVRVMCSCHTGVMSDLEFGLLRHAPVSNTVGFVCSAE